MITNKANIRGLNPLVNETKMFVIYTESEQRKVEG